MNFKFIISLILLFSIQAVFGKENPNIKKIDEPEKSYSLVIVIFITMTAFIITLRELLRNTKVISMVALL